MTKSKIAALVATLALGALAAGCSTTTNDNNANMTKPANTSMAPTNTAKPANTAAPANANMKMPQPPKPAPTKKP